MYKLVGHHLVSTADTGSIASDAEYHDDMWAVAHHPPGQQCLISGWANSMFFV